MGSVVVIRSAVFSHGISNWKYTEKFRYCDWRAPLFNVDWKDKRLEYLLPQSIFFLRVHSYVSGEGHQHRVKKQETLRKIARSSETVRSAQLFFKYYGCVAYRDCLVTSDFKASIPLANPMFVWLRIQNSQILTRVIQCFPQSQTFLGKGVKLVFLLTKLRHLTSHYLANIVNRLYLYSSFVGYFKEAVSVWFAAR